MLALLRRKSILKPKFLRQYKTCPEDDNFFSTTIKVNLFTFIIGGFFTGTISRLITSSHVQLKNEIQELKKEINKLNNKS
jgi:hypothetical protein